MKYIALSLPKLLLCLSIFYSNPFHWHSLPENRSQTSKPGPKASHDWIPSNSFSLDAHESLTQSLALDKLVDRSGACYMKYKKS